MTGEQHVRATGEGAFASELRTRFAEAEAALAAAEALEDPLLAQIAEGDVADLRALAARNDVELDGTAARREDAGLGSA